MSTPVLVLQETAPHLSNTCTHYKYFNKPEPHSRREMLSTTYVRIVHACMQARKHTGESTYAGWPSFLLQLCVHLLITTATFKTSTAANYSSITHGHGNKNKHTMRNHILPIRGPRTEWGSLVENCFVAKETVSPAVEERIRVKYDVCEL